MTPTAQIQRALEWLRGPAEVARTYVLLREPDDAGSAEGLWEVLQPLDTPLAALVEAVGGEGTGCLLCEHINPRKHFPDCALMRLVAAVNGGEE